MFLHRSPGRESSLCSEPRSRLVHLLQALKNRACYNKIVAREELVGHKYDYILRTRPDLEYGHSLREASVWATLPNDIVWTLIVDDNKDIIDDRKRVLKKGAFKTLPIESVDFIADFMKVLPRPVLKRYLGVSPPMSSRDD